MSSKKCLYPESSLTIEANGDVRLCSSSLPISNLIDNDISIQSLWTSSLYTDISSSLSKGIFPRECISCEMSEKECLKSRRQSFNEKRAKGISGEEFDSLIGERNIKHMSIAFSNYCNLQCSMCGSLYSTSWRKLDEQALKDGINFRERQIAKPFELNDKQVLELVEIALNADTILLKGGEPLLSNKCILFLKELSKSSNRPNIFIQTNGTFLNNEVLDLIGELGIDIGVSIDGVHECYEWIRGFSFSQVVENLSILRDNMNKNQLFVDFTTSVFNFHNINDFLHYFKNFEGIDKISFTTIARQQYNSIRNLPIDYRKNISSNLIFNELENLEGIDELLEYAQAETFSKSKRLTSIKWLEFLEKSRGEFPSSELQGYLRS